MYVSSQDFQSTTVIVSTFSELVSKSVDGIIKYNDFVSSVHIHGCVK